jgi:metal-responsive CopG/Arc/MetJ family transcriptional regulator
MDQDQTQRVIVPLPSALLKRVDDWRYDHRLPSRAAAIRELLESGLSLMSVPIAIQPKRKPKP